MLRRIPRQVSCTAVVVAFALAPVAARAQSIPPVAESRAPPRAPSIIVSMAASPFALDDWRRSDGPALVGSVQGRLNRFLVLEGEATRWTVVDDFGFTRGVSQGGAFFASEHRDREVWTVGTNLLFRGGTSRVTGFAGGGLGVRFVQEDSSSSFVGLPGPGRPTFWGVALRTTDAVREPPPFPDLTRAMGKDVRVTLNDGTTQRGTLETLSASDFTLEGKAIKRHGLDVRGARSRQWHRRRRRDRRCP